MATPKILGSSFLKDHPRMQAEKEIDSKHVIVDKEDYDLVLRILETMPLETLLKFGVSRFSKACQSGRVPAGKRDTLL